VKSSLTFLRKTDWARKKVEELYLRTEFWEKELRDFLTPKNAF
jgi:uncharacterized protein (DUF2132 family)